MEENMEEEKTEEKPEEEAKEEASEEASSEQKIPEVEDAKKAASELKEQNDRKEKFLEREEKLIARQEAIKQLGGGSLAGQAEPKEETPAEYTKRVMGGRV
jgi:hypothetical protein